MLEQTHPGISTELHRRACRWYEEQGMIPESLQHAISSGDMQLVAQKISANVLVLVECNETGPILEKIDSLPTDEVIALPWLGIARAWVLGAGQIQKSLHILDAVEKERGGFPGYSRTPKTKRPYRGSKRFCVRRSRGQIECHYTYQGSKRVATCR
jgi:ATP/maltotriose-dependent transcriptional regulator MalT